MFLFTFEPGDGVVYRVLFGRLASATPLIPFYTVIGIAEGFGSPGTWYAFDQQYISEDTFDRRFGGEHAFNIQTYFTAWRLWLALTGQEEDTQVVAVLPPWRDDWRAQLPTAALG